MPRAQTSILEAGDYHLPLGVLSAEAAIRMAGSSSADSGQPHPVEFPPDTAA